MKLHIITILFAGISATFWGVYATDIFIPLIWLLLLIVWIAALAPSEFKVFLRRFSQIGLMLCVISIVQIVFRRQGTILFEVHGFPLIFSNGLNEAVLLWIRFMIIFMLAFIFGQIPLFDFFHFLNKIRMPVQMSLIILITLKFIPFIFEEAKKGLWSLRFRGIQLRSLSLKNKYAMIKKILTPLLFRGMHFVAYSALALELRGYGIHGRVRIDRAFYIAFRDVLVLALIVGVNGWGLYMHFGR